MAVDFHVTGERIRYVDSKLPLTSTRKLAVITEEGRKERKGYEVDENQ